MESTGKSFGGVGVEEGTPTPFGAAVPCRDLFAAADPVRFSLAVEQFVESRFQVGVSEFESGLNRALWNRSLPGQQDG